MICELHLHGKFTFKQTEWKDDGNMSPVRVREGLGRNH